MEDLGKLIVAIGFKKLPKVPKVAQSGHTDAELRKQCFCPQNVVQIKRVVPGLWVRRIVLTNVIYL